jgi:hypothetical protein
MAEEKKPSKVKEFFSNHGEKVALGLAAAGLVAYLVMGVLMAKDDKSAKDLDARAIQINDHKGRDHANDPDMKVPEAKPWFVKGTDPWSKVVTAKAGSDWIATSLSEPVGSAIEVAVVKPKKIVIPKISIGGADVALDGVSFGWAAENIKKEDIEKDNLDPKKIDYYVIEREEGGSGKWEVLSAKHPGGSTSYKDSKIKPRTQYSYRVTSYTEDKDYRDAVESKGKGNTAALAQPVNTLGIWGLRWISVSKDSAYIEVEKFEQSQGGKVKIALIHKAGDRIGGKKDPLKADDPPVFDHLVPLAGTNKAIKVNFDTKMTLVSVTPATPVEFQIKKCKAKYEGVKKIGCDTVKEKVTVQTTEILYTDEDGKEVKVYNPDPAQDRRAQDQLCEEHAPKTVISAGTGSKTTKAGPVDQGREKEAEEVWNKAQTAEKIGAAAKGAAIVQYERLVNEFAETQFVTKRRAQIDERLAKLRAP